MHLKLCGQHHLANADAHKDDIQQAHRKKAKPPNRSKNLFGINGAALAELSISQQSAAKQHK